MSTRRKLGK